MPKRRKPQQDTSPAPSAPQANPNTGDGFSLAFEIGELGRAPDPDDALAYGRVLAERSGMSVPADATPRITQRANGDDFYRVEIPAQYT